ncbi:putative GTP-binding protein rhoA [Rosellinia necatrix]|uniref:Putative GTP-binding protein rhoA n=1 Tax=Rosellinia necatrix TaxID=77044 RepID=A0A1W2TQ67_ROSNE|nr:putative GTP-binding protein rhoA [Rosellinia necatrix]
MEDHSLLAEMTKPGAGSSLERSQQHPLPTLGSFTFSLSDFWKPTTDPHHDSEDDSSCEGRPHKRAKTDSSVYQSTTGTRRSKLVNSGRNLIHQVSKAYQRVATPGIKSRAQSSASMRPGSHSRRGRTPAPEPTPSPGTPSFALIDRPRMRFVFVGDSECGKSSLLLRFYRDTFTEHYTPTQYELFNKVVAVNDQDTDIELWDTSGDAALEQLSRLNYLAWDAVFLCFSIDSIRSFNHARTKWITQIRRYTGGAPLFFVGTKTDRRVGAGLWSPLYPNLETRITATEGSMTATALGATRYVECSAKTGQGIHGVFEEGVRAVFGRRAAADAAAGGRERREGRGAEPLSGLAGFFCFK